MLLKIFFWLLYLSNLYFCVNACSEIDLVNSFAKHIRNYVTLITKLQGGFSSPTPGNIIQEFVKKFPTIIANTDELTTHSGNETLHSIKNIFTSKSQQHDVLNVIIIDSKDKHITEELLESVEFLENFVIQSPVSKCAIIVINSKNNMDIQQFFKWTWIRKFLYITVIEWLPKRKYKNKFFFNPDDSELIVHQHNPFNNSYKSEIFSITTELFFDKLSNLHRFPLATSLHEEFPAVVVIENYNANSIWDAIHGIDVEIIQALVKTVNFSVDVKQIYSENKYLQKFNTTSQRSILHEFDNSDFSFNLVTVLGRPTMEGYTDCKLGTLLYPYSYSILTEQNGTYRISMAFYVIIFALIMTVCIVILTLIFKFDVKVWTLYNIFTILVGRSIKPEPQKVNERIFFLCLTIIYIIFFTHIMEHLLNLHFYQKIYPKLDLLEELIEFKIVPHIVNHTINLMLNSNDKVLQDLAKISESLEAYPDIDDCVSTLLSKEVRSDNGCQILTMVGDLIQKHLECDEAKRLISLVNQPLLNGWAAMMHSPMSHYVKRFDDVMRRMFEGGLIYLWTRNMMEHYPPLKGNLNFTSDVYLTKDGDLKTEQWFTTGRIIYGFLIGYSISWLIFMCEIAWPFFKISWMQKREKKWKFARFFPLIK